MRYWLELRSALTLSRLGTVSAAAREIGVHRSTINRHIDTLELAFKNRMFQRHARGYALTDAGREIIQIAEQADQMFSEVQARQRGAADLTSGTLRVTAVSGIAPILMPSIKSFEAVHPHVPIEYYAESKVLQLETGEAHIAFRSGPEPKEPDYVVQPFRPIRFALYASRDYVDRFGKPDLDDLGAHRFVAPIPENAYPPYQKWFEDNVPAESIALKSGSRPVRNNAICNGIGIGFIDDVHATWMKDLIEVAPADDAHSVEVWIVTHVDLHRTPNIMAFLEHLNR
ncbi:MAG: LysR family transcriptional regulator [Pseudomonadota bacterium]